MLVTDEGLGSQDETGPQKLVEAVNRVQGDSARNLVITHIETIWGIFPTRIEMAKTPQGSMAHVF